MKLLCIFAMLALFCSRAAIAATDPFAGKWVLDEKQSECPDKSCPTSMTIEMEPVGHGVHYQSDSTFADGRTTHSEYTAEYNGVQVLVTGKHGFMLPVSLKRIDARTVVASYTKGLLVVATSRRTISQDGRRMTITTTSKDLSGTSITTISTYKKQ
jgi:hypothetical protein